MTINLKSEHLWPLVDDFTANGPGKVDFDEEGDPIGGMSVPDWVARAMLDDLRLLQAEVARLQAELIATQDDAGREFSKKDNRIADLEADIASELDIAYMNGVEINTLRKRVAKLEAGSWQPVRFDDPYNDGPVWVDENGCVCWAGANGEIQRLVLHGDMKLCLFVEGEEPTP